MGYRPRSKTCEWCGRTWMAAKPQARTCSPLCRARLRETEKPTRGSTPRTYPEDQVRQVRELYNAGMTQDEIALKAGTSQKVIWRLMLNHGITARPLGKRDQAGEKNAYWRGDGAGYDAFHARVIAARGRPEYCAACDKAGPGRYEWANLSGRYEDINDYVRLCPRCHRRLDAHRRKVTGKPTSPKGGGATCPAT